MKCPTLYRPLPLYVTAFAALLSFAPAVGLAAKDASIALPEGFPGSATTTAFTGFGGYNRGNYTGAEFTGEFVRIESRVGVFDPLYVANRGKSSFTVEPLGEYGQLAADCRAAENVVTVRVVTLDTKKLTYQCEFSGSASAEQWRFVLGEPTRDGFKEKLLARERRRGEAMVLGQEIVIDSVHNYDGSRFSSQAPLGYVLESGGTVIAAVDLLDWNPIVHIRDGLSESARYAAMVVALSLAVLRDPANSALED